MKAMFALACAMVVSNLIAVFWLSRALFALSIARADIRLIARLFWKGITVQGNSREELDALKRLAGE